MIENDALLMDGEMYIVRVTEIPRILMTMFVLFYLSIQCLNYTIYTSALAQTLIRLCTSTVYTKLYGLRDEFTKVANYTNANNVKVIDCNGIKSCQYAKIIVNHPKSLFIR